MYSGDEVYGDDITSGALPEALDELDDEEDDDEEESTNAPAEKPEATS